VVRRGQEPPPTDLPQTLAIQLEAAGRMLGRYTVTDVSVGSVVRDGVDVTEEDRNLLMASLMANLLDTDIVVKISLLNGYSNNCTYVSCPNKEFWHPYFEDGQMIMEVSHLHRVTMPTGKVCQETVTAKNTYRLNCAGELLVTWSTDSFFGGPQGLVRVKETVMSKAKKVDV
jgi:hypothetical protein